jgi:hypothetical protein
VEQHTKKRDDTKFERQLAEDQRRITEAFDELGEGESTTLNLEEADGHTIVVHIDR